MPAKSLNPPENFDDPVFGDGTAARRIISISEEYLSCTKISMPTPNS